jgi:hypothetical protein
LLDLPGLYKEIKLTRLINLTLYQLRNTRVIMADREANIEALVGMGFTREKAELGLTKTQNRDLQSALDWLLAHADDAMDVDKPSGNTLGSGSSAPPPGSEGKAFHEGFLCDGCKGPIYGIRYRCTKCGNYDLCELCEKKGVHSETEHNFYIIEQPVDITQQPGPRELTEEEKEAALKRAEELIKKRREEKKKQEALDELEREKRRREQGKEAAAAQAKWKEEQQALAIAKAKREKEEEAKAREKIKEQIRLDKLAREQAEKGVAPAPTPVVPQQQVIVPAKAPSEYTECTLQIRLTNGAVLKNTFQPS